MYFLIGGAGVPNFGDELMVRQWIDHLINKDIKNITVSGVRKTALDRMFPLHYPNVITTNSIYRYLSKAEPNFSEAFLAGYTSLEGENSLKHYDEEITNTLLSSSVF